jgi:hypothetical protein
MAELDATTELIRSLEDPTRWVKINRVSVFKPHTAVGDNGQYTVTDNDIRKIAENTNRAYRGDGHPVRLTIGHLDRKSPTAKQPPFAGFAVNYSAKMVERPGGPVLRLTHDEYVMRSMANRWRALPYRSVEYDRHNLLIRGCAGIIETPRLELGAVVPYASADANSVIYYSTGETAVPDMNEPNDADGTTDDTAEMQVLATKVAELLKPQIQTMIAEAMKGGGATAPPPPTETQNASGRGEDQYSQLNSQLAVVKAELAATRRDAERQVCERMIDTIADHYSLDRGEEVQYMLPLTPDARTKRLDYLRKHLRPLPVGPMIRVELPRQGNSGSDDSPLSQEEAYVAREYKEQKGCSWEQAYAHVRTKRTAK